MAKNSTIDIGRLMRLEPISALSNERLDELAKLAYVERVSIGVSLFREGDLDNQTLYLLHGDVQLSSSDGSFDEVISSRHNSAKFPLDDSQPRQVSCVALGLVEFLRIDNSVLDYMMMWDQLAVQEELLDTSNKDNAESEIEQADVKALDENEASEEKSDIDDSNVSESYKAAEPEPEPEPVDDTVDTPSDNTDNDGIETAESTSGDAQSLGESEEELACTEQIVLGTKSAISKDEPNTKDSLNDEPEIIHAVDNSNEIVDKQKDTPEKGAWMRRMRHIMAFKNLPPANIKELLERMEQVKVKQGDVIVNQGEQGDSFYVLTDGEAKVTRTIELAELKAGSGFGEESLVSGGERNASITMKTDGILMRLAKKDFDELLKEPMLNRLSPEDARNRAFKGDHWLDVRHASEYHHSHLHKASNLPLHEVRMRMQELDKSLHYICYCNTGRRSSAAAFILAQSGFKVSVLNGGVRVMPQDLVKG